MRNLFLLHHCSDMTLDVNEVKAFVLWIFACSFKWVVMALVELLQSFIYFKCDLLFSVTSWGFFYVEYQKLQWCLMTNDMVFKDEHRSCFFSATLFRWLNRHSPLSNATSSGSLGHSHLHESHDLLGRVKGAAECIFGIRQSLRAMSPACPHAIFNCPIKLLRDLTKSQVRKFLWVTFWVDGLPSE